MYNTIAHVSGIFTENNKRSSLVQVARCLISLTLIASMLLAVVPHTLARTATSGASSTKPFFLPGLGSVAGVLPWFGRGTDQKGEAPAPELVSPQRPPTKDELKQKVARIELNSPGEVQLQSQEPMVFAAIPLDSEGHALHGLAVQWESSDQQVIFVKPDGQAVAGLPGRAHLTATAGNKKEKVWVTVVKCPKERFGGKKQTSASEEEEVGRHAGERRVKVVKAGWNPVENIWPVASQMRYGRAARVVNAAFRLREPNDRTKSAAYFAS
jgi:hypothetical protein